MVFGAADHFQGSVKAYFATIFREAQYFSNKPAKNR